MFKMSMAKREQYLTTKDDDEWSPLVDMEYDDLPDLLCEDCGCVVGWDDNCLCNTINHQHA